MKHNCIGPLVRAGIDYDDAHALRRIAMTLHRWHELECNGEVHRDEDTGRVCGYFPDFEIGFPVADRETGAMKRLAKIMAKYPTLQPYIQGDPRGAALYILRPGDVPDGASVDSYYSRGLAVYK